MRSARRGYDEHKGDEALCEMMTASSFVFPTSNLENLKRIGLGFYFGPDSEDDRPDFTAYGRFKANLLIDAIENGLKFINLKFRYDDNFNVTHGNWTIRSPALKIENGRRENWRLFISKKGINVSFTATAENINPVTGNVVSRKDNILSKKVGEEQLVETKSVSPVGYIRWNVCFKSGVSTPVREEPVDAALQTEPEPEPELVDAVVQTEPEPEISPRISLQQKEKKTLCSFLGFSCQKK